MIVGVLALQGDFAEHIAVLRAIKVDAHEIRTLSDLRSVSHLIIPGGESTTMSLLLQKMALHDQIRERVHTGDLAVYGTCAGAILLASEVTGKHAPTSLALIDMTIERNAYGSQAQSFESTLTIEGVKTPVTASFIRAPRILKTGPEVQILAHHANHPVLVREGRVLASTFHPEVRGNTTIHQLFLQI